MLSLSCGCHVMQWQLRIHAHAEPTQSKQRVFPAFPHEPYSIQLDFMRALYDTVDAGGIGLFESPTGVCRSRCEQQSCTMPMPCVASVAYLARRAGPNSAGGQLLLVVVCVQ